MTNFGDWKYGVYDSIYNDFQQRQDTRLETRMTQTFDALRRRNRISERTEMFESFPFNDIFESPLGVIFRDMFLEYIDIPCFSCGEPTKKRKNHIYSRALMNRFLSENGHIAGFYSGTERKIVEMNNIQWSFLADSFRIQGINQVPIFYGFCSRCDHETFRNADSGTLVDENQQSVFEQLYRVLCATYYVALNHTVIYQYLIEFINNHHLFLLAGMRNPVTKKNIEMSELFLLCLEYSHKLFNLMKDFERVLSSYQDTTKYCREVIRVQEPSIIGSFFLLDHKRKDIKIRGIVRSIEATGVLGIVYPVSNTKTVSYIVGLPSGLSPLNNDLFFPYRDIAREGGFKIVLSKILLENQLSVKNLILRPSFFNSLSEQEKDMLTQAPYVKGNDNTLEVNLFK